MINILFCIFTSFIFSSKTLKTNTQLNQQIEYTSLEMSLIIDKNGFYPNKIFLNINTSLKLKIANILNKDASFTNSKLGIYKGIKPKSTNKFEIKFSKSGTYKFLCPINKTKVNILVEW